MYLKKKSLKRKTFAPISAKRRKQRRIKALFLLFIICLFLFLLYWCLSKGFEYLFEHKSQWFTWKAKNLIVQAQDADTEQQIKDILSFKEDTLISNEDAKNLQNSLKNKLGHVQNIEVKRGFFSKKLTIKAKNYDVLAKIQVKEQPYLLSDTGVLFNYEKAPIPDDILKIKINQEIKGSFLPQELVKLLKDLSKSSLTGLDFVEINLDEQTFNLFFKDGSVVDMGLFDLYNDKIVALKDIIEVSQKRGFKKPYKIDFGYFKNGKIYLNTQV